MWCFCGQVVVICVVNAGLVTGIFFALKNVTEFWDLFFWISWRGVG